MITSTLFFNSASQANGARAARTKAMIAAVAVSIAGLGLILPEPASASCYGSGHSRYCDGVGGPGATYSRRGNSGTTTYSTGRRQTYKTYYY
tara:strand:+ start:407 stop:682 length:276 start_codon:yes stop_codon:yes gene_type:complete